MIAKQRGWSRKVADEADAKLKEKELVRDIVANLDRKEPVIEALEKFDREL